MSSLANDYTHTLKVPIFVHASKTIPSMHSKKQPFHALVTILTLGYFINRYYLLMECTKQLSIPNQTFLKAT